MWWDPKLRAGEHFDDAIEEEIRNAKCVIVLWSKLSTESEYVKDEASLARKLGKLVPVAIDNSELPFRFQRVHTIQMHGWEGSTADAGFLALVEQLESKLGLASAATAPATSKSSDRVNALWPISPKTESQDDGIAAILRPKPIRLGERQPQLQDFASLTNPVSSVLPLKTISAEEAGYKARTLLAIQSELKTAFSLVQGFSDYARMRTYGLLGPEQLAWAPNGERYFSVSWKIWGPGILAESEKLLRKLDEAGADAVDYTPPQLQKLSQELRNTAFHQFNIGMWAGGGPLKITQRLIDMYVQGYKRRAPNQFPDREVADIREIARQLGFRFKA